MIDEVCFDLQIVRQSLILILHDFKYNLAELHESGNSES